MDNIALGSGRGTRQSRVVTEHVAERASVREGQAHLNGWRVQLH